MKISILGTGDVGQTLAERLMSLGHEVMIGTRDVDNTLSRKSRKNGNSSFKDWYESNSNMKLGNFQDSAAFGELVINATNGANSLNALDLAGEEILAGKILIDVANPLDFNPNTGPVLLEGLNNNNSLGEEIQKEFPETKVVKTFNTIWCKLMVNPGMIGDGDHINYISGNDDEAKGVVRKLLKEMGWKNENLIDLGDISAARATESYLLLWVRLNEAIDSGAFNIKIVK